MNQENIRNFVIIAHIDHGKSTLADRMLEITDTISADKIKPQMLDTMDLERERGITIKLQPVTMKYDNYIFNLIDTPGHVDFSYEVSRSLAAVEGAILVVDATRGIQAQTLANLHYAQKNNLIIIPVINKIDLANARIGEVEKEIESLLDIDKVKILKVSAKTGEGVDSILKRIITDVPAPQNNKVGESDKNFKALIFDSVYDSFRGAIAYVRAVQGQVQKGDKIKFMATEKMTDVLEVGEFRLDYVTKDVLRAGEIGYIVTGEKDLSEVKVGDTIILNSPAEVSPIAGFKIPQSVVFAGIFTTTGDPITLRRALEKLSLNDSSLVFTPENSDAFGHGFRAGFLGMLHLEIVKERLEREYNLDLIITQPQVQYKIDSINNKIEYQEPWVSLEIITPAEYLGPIMELLSTRRAIYKDTKYLGDQVLLVYESPLAEIIIDFYDKLKSVSQGYASQNYDMIGYREGDLIKLDVVIAGDTIEEFSRVVPRLRASSDAQNLAKKLKELIPRQMFEVSIQIANGGRILARENISARSKDVTAKLYGGDRTRKDKLIKKQAAGKKRMKMLGRVEIPSDVFIEILKS